MSLGLHYFLRKPNKALPRNHHRTQCRDPPQCLRHQSLITILSRHLQAHIRLRDQPLQVLPRSSNRNNPRNPRRLNQIRFLPCPRQLHDRLLHFLLLNNLSRQPRHLLLHYSISPRQNRYRSMTKQLLRLLKQATELKLMMTGISHLLCPMTPQAYLPQII